MEELKKEYIKTGATMHLKMSGWDELEKRIDLISPKTGKHIRTGFAFTSLLILLFFASLFGLFKTAEAAMPGNPLYPVKILSEKLIQKASGSNQVAIDHRADEIITLSQQQEINKGDLKQVVQEYTQNVEQAKTELKNTGKPSINFQNSLDEQHSKFDQLGKDHPDIKQEIEDAQKVSDKEGDHSGNRSGD